MRRKLLTLLFLLGLSGASAAAETPAEFVSQADLASASCSFAKAYALSTRALDALKADPGTDPKLIGFVENRLAANAYSLGRMKDSEAHARRAIDLIERTLGDKSPELAAIKVGLANTLIEADRLNEAGGLLDAAIATLSVEAGHSSSWASRLGSAYQAEAALAIKRSAFSEAVTFANKSVAEAEASSDPARLADTLLKLADTAIAAEDITSADAAVARAATIINTGKLSRLDPRLLRTRGLIAKEKSDLTMAMTLLDQAATESGADPCSPLLKAEIIYQKGSIDLLRRDAVAAERAFRDVLRLYDQFGLHELSRVADCTYGFAIAESYLGEFDEAVTAFKNAGDSYLASYGPNSLKRAQTLAEMSWTLSQAGHASQAAATARLAADILTHLKENLPIETAMTQSALARALEASGDFKSAHAAFTWVLSEMEKLRGKDWFNLPPIELELAQIDVERKEPSSARDVLAHAIAVQQKTGWTTGMGLARSYSLMAEAEADLGDAVQARAFTDKAIAVLEERMHVQDPTLSSLANEERYRAREVFERDLAIVSAGGKTIISDPGTVDRLFHTAQMAQVSRTSVAVANMAARFSAVTGALADRIRERQDAVAQWNAINDRLQGQQGNQTADLRAAYSSLAVLERKIAGLDEVLAREFPNYQVMTQPQPLSLAAAQALLRPDEAILFISFAEDRAYSFVLTAHGAQALRSSMSKSQAEQIVRRIRATVDTSLMNVPALTWETLPPFDYQDAYEMFSALIDPLGGSLLNVHRLLVVTDGPLSSIPLGMLVMHAPSQPIKTVGDHAKLAYLAENYAVTVIPSVDSLRAFRRAQQTMPSSQRFLGIGDPVLTKGSSGLRGIDLNNITRGPVADINLLRSAFHELPNTSVELKMISRELNGKTEDLYLRERADEALIRSKDLLPYGIVAFATHGLLPNELRGFAEPGLVLTPPPKPSRSDDGILTASEIASLKLNAKWVILSACNTAASDGRSDGEALSGLARAFIYAGARNLYVSNWAVETNSAEKLTTETMRFAAAGAAPDVAAQRAQIELIHNAQYAHPFFWAPLSVVGAD